MPHISRYKRKESDQSGFKFYEIELVKSGPYKVAQNEFDTPPPSKKSLGGEGDISGDYRVNSDFSTSGTANILEVTPHPTFYITAVEGITPNFVHPFMYVSGSNTAVDITANPQISAGKEGRVLTLVCVGSGITLDNAAGLNLMGSAQFVMTSGSVISFIYNTGGTVWSELFRMQQGGFSG